MVLTASDRPGGIRRTFLSTLEDVDFADDLALVSHAHQYMQEKTTRLSMFPQQESLKISQTKSEVMMLNISNPGQSERRKYSNHRNIHPPR